MIKNKMNIEDTANKLKDYQEIFINGEIGLEVKAEDVTKELSKQKNKRILLNVFSRGGYVFDAFAIYDYIFANNINCDIAIHGISGSAATIISCAGKKVYIGANSFYFIHNPHGGSKDILDKAKEKIIEIYEQRTGLSQKRIIELMDAGDKGAVLTPEQAVDYGFVDEIIIEKITNNFVINNIISEPLLSKLKINIREDFSESDIVIKKQEEIMDAELKAKVTELEIHNSNFKKENENLKNIISENEKNLEKIETENKDLSVEVEKIKNAEIEKKKTDIENYVNKLIEDNVIEPKSKEDIINKINNILGENNFDKEKIENDILFKTLLKNKIENGKELEMNAETEKETGLKKEEYDAAIELKNKMEGVK